MLRGVCRVRKEQGRIVFGALLQRVVGEAMEAEVVLCIRKRASARCCCCCSQSKQSKKAHIEVLGHFADDAGEGRGGDEVLDAGLVPSGRGGVR